MKVAYLDTSWLVAVAFDDEPDAAEWATELARYDVVASANLLDAEFRAALRREGVDGGEALLAGIARILRDRPLGAEIGRVLLERHVRGADLWHLAVALFFADDPGDVDLLTLDADQREVADALGFGGGGR